MTQFWSFFVHKRSFSYLMVGALAVFGLYSVITIRKESAPEVQVPVVIVTTLYPGASALDVERLVTNKIEEQLANNLSDVKKITSSSRESLSVVVAEFRADADLESAIADTKDEVDKVKPELPTDTEDPRVEEVNFVDQPIITISVSSDLPVTETIALIERVEDELKQVKGVSRIETSGIPEREVQVVARKEALATYGISVVQIVQAVAQANSSLPVGSIRLDGSEYTVKFEGTLTDPQALADIAILAKGDTPVYLRDLAVVSNGVSKTSTFTRVSIAGSTSAPSVSLSVYKKSGEDVGRISDGIKAKVNEMQDGMLKGMPVLISYDTAKYIDEDLKNLSSTAMQTVVLVILILLVTIGVKESLIAGVSIPLSFLISFIGLVASGNTINFVSLFSLILAVGILVDSAIVVTEAMHTKMREGMGGVTAAIETIKEFQWPLISGTMTTVAVFVPLFFISGVTGEFIASIPFTIIFLLIASLFVALAVVPLIGSRMLAHSRDTAWAARRESYTTLFQEWYRAKISAVLGVRKKENWLIAALSIAFVCALALPPLGLVKTIFFPPQDADFLFIDIEKPQGTVLDETDNAVREVEALLYPDTRIDSFITTVGSSSQFGSATAGQKNANITVILKDRDQRDVTSLEILSELRARFAGVTSATVRVFQPEGGPPVGAPILIKFFGDDLSVLDQAVIKAAGVLKSVPGTAEVRTSTRNNENSFVLTLDRAKLSSTGLTALQVAQTLRTALYGTTATSIKRADGDIDVVVKLNLNPDFTDPHDTNRTTIDAIKQLMLPTPKGPILFGSLAGVSLEQSNAVISHEDHERIATVSSELAEGALSADVTKQFKARMADVALPKGVRMVIGGENEEVDQSFREMFIALIAGSALIGAILVLQFNSFRQAIYIIIAVPLSLIGILFGLAITGKTLSFPSMMGFIALSGIVVNNSIILIDVMNNLRKERPHAYLKDIVVEGAVSRLRPILLTTSTTVIGMIPLTYASELWAPLAFAIIFGLTFATILTLMLVPMLYLRWPGKSNEAQ